MALALSKKWGMLKVYNCIDFSVHPCIALSSDTFCIGKKLYIPLYWEKVILGQKKARKKAYEKKKLKKNNLLQNKATRNPLHHQTNLGYIDLFHLLLL
jgi:hypothetical protein